MFNATTKHRIGIHAEGSGGAVLFYNVLSFVVKD